MHLADAFIQSDLQYIQVIHFCQYMCSLGYMKYNQSVFMKTFALFAATKSVSKPCWFCAYMKVQ